jgi:uncharacterized membrane protein (UPF0127 family)
MNNALRSELLAQTKKAQQLGFKGSIMDVLSNPTILQEFTQQQNRSRVEVASTPEQQQQGLRGVPANQMPDAMVFPNVKPNTSFNTQRMRAPINIEKYDNQGHLVKSYENVPPGITNLPMGPQRGTVIETPANVAQSGGRKKYQSSSPTEYFEQKPLTSSDFDYTTDRSRGNARFFGDPVTGEPFPLVNLPEAEVVTQRTPYNQLSNQSLLAGVSQAKPWFEAGNKEMGYRVLSERLEDLQRASFINEFTGIPAMGRTADRIKNDPADLFTFEGGLDMLGFARPLTAANRGAKALGRQLSPLAKSTSKQLAGSRVASSVDDVGRGLTQAPKPAWQLQELPGLHLKSTMEGEAISKIVEPKTGLINTEQALAIIGKESGGADKVALIRQALGNNVPKKMDFNDFRKTVQDQLIPLKRQFVDHSSNYGVNRLGYKEPEFITRTIDGKVINEMTSDVIENQTLILGNKSKFGRGSSAHGNPEETLGHAHFLRDAETPDVLTVTQIQSDAFQGTHRTSLKTKKQAQFSYDRQLEYFNKNKEKIEGIKKLDDNTYQFPDGQKISKGAYDNMFSGLEESLALSKADLENFTQKQLLDKNHQERYLQELVDYAGKRGDVNKVRVPTSETAAKVQGYQKHNPMSSNFEYSDKYPKELNDLVKNVRNASRDNYDDAVKELNSYIKTNNPNFLYSSEHQTILKKYAEQPKTIKKLFGKEPAIITDSKGNTWYEFDIPDKFKKGKGEIKAFGVVPLTVGTGLGAAAVAGSEPRQIIPPNFKYGGPVKYQNGGLPGEMLYRSTSAGAPLAYNSPTANGYLLPDPNRPELMNTGATEYKMGVDDVTIPTVVNGQYMDPETAYQRYKLTGEKFKPTADPSAYSKFYDEINKLGLMKYKKGGGPVKLQSGNIPPIVSLPEVEIAEQPSWKVDREKLSPDKINWWESFNFKKWGLNDYSDFSSFNSAFRNARKSKEDEFVWKGKRFNTELAPKEVSERYFDSKKFLEDYYTTEPFFKQDTSTMGKIDAWEGYITSKYGTTWSDYYDKVENLPDVFREGSPQLDTLNMLQKPRFYKNFPEEAKAYAEKATRDKYIQALNDPSYYFSITSQPDSENPVLGYQDAGQKKFYISNTEPTSKKFHTTSVHELSHKADTEDRLSYITSSRIPEIDIDKLNTFGSNLSQGRFDYITDPTETEARKMSTLYYMNRALGKDVKSGQIKQSDLDELYKLMNESGGYSSKNSALPRDILDILELYKHQQKDLLKYLNNDFSYSKRKQSGGKKPKYKAPKMY